MNNLFCAIHNYMGTADCPQCVPEPKPVTAEELAKVIDGAGNDFQTTMKLQNKDDWDEWFATVILEKYGVRRK